MSKRIVLSLFKTQNSQYISQNFISVIPQQSLNSSIKFGQRNFFTSIKTSSNEAVKDVAKLEHANGFIKLTLPLLARQERCLFTLKPVNDNVGKLIEYVKNEDKGIDRAALYTLDGLRISHNTSIGVLVQKPFKLQLNEIFYLIEAPVLPTPAEVVTGEKQIEMLRDLVAKLYLELNVEEHDKQKEIEILKNIETLKTELEPLEKTKEAIAEKAKKHTNRMIWFGLGLMGVQAGVLARLTWFDYSWDIVEPISYFVTYIAVIGVYAYFVLTRKEYDYESASDRIFLRNFHKNALKSNLDVEKYNHLKDKIMKLEEHLQAFKNKNKKIEL